MDLKRKRLSLKEKVKVIEVAETEKLSLRQLAEKFGISKNQVGNVLKDKDEIKKLWMTNSNENSKTVKFRKTEASEIDSIIFNWFCSVRAKNIPVSGIVLQEKAKEVAESLGIMNFKASNGWLEKFKLRHNISFKVVCGEAKSVDPKHVTDWVEKLKEVCEGYEAKDIYNLDETGLFFRVLPNKTCFKDEKCIGGKVSKERLTVLLCCNMEGDFEMPLVIGKAKKPRCFKNVDPKTLSVQWESNRKAWMNISVMSNWLIALDKKMRKEKRKILLFMDNATAHPQDLKLNYVKLVFFPPNTTSVLQPLDQGIIRSFKTAYRKLFLRHVLSQSSSCENSEQLAKCVNVLNAIHWITAAVNSVSENCVKQCFKKAGFIKVPSVDELNEYAEENTELQELVKDCGSNVAIQDYVAIDEQLCTEETNEDITAFIPTVNSEGTDIKCSEDQESEEEEEESCEIQNFKDALKYTEQLQKFFLNVGDNEGLSLIGKLNIHVEKNACKMKSSKQTLLLDYFK